MTAERSGNGFRLSGKKQFVTQSTAKLTLDHAVAHVKATLPHGQVTVRVVKGGLDIPSDEGHDTAVVAGAAVAVRMELPQAR